jgi:hypothetical protein
MSLELVREVKRRRAQAGFSLVGQCGAFGITNEVAATLNQMADNRKDSLGRLPWGLLLKTGGNRAIPQPDGSCKGDDQASGDGYATDYIIQRDTWLGFDILGDGGGRNEPQWGEPETGQEARNERYFVNPFIPQPAPGPTPELPPVLPGGGPLPPASTDAAMLQRFQHLENLLKDSHLHLSQEIGELKLMIGQLTLAGPITIFGRTYQLVLRRTTPAPPKVQG